MGWPDGGGKEKKKRKKKPKLSFGVLFLLSVPVKPAERRNRLSAGLPSAKVVLLGTVDANGGGRSIACPSPKYKVCCSVSLAVTFCNH